MREIDPNFLRLMPADPGIRAARHIVVGISDPSDDPSRHRTFHIAAVYDALAKGWRAAITEENANAQPGPWRQQSDAHHQAVVASTAAACLGQALEMVVSVVACDAEQLPSKSEHG